tara:strand:- start:19839 stop:21188 length:1350 start_codon:yes stop_codon:yes gene_type:complete
MLTEINEDSPEEVVGIYWNRFYGDVFVDTEYDGKQMLKDIKLPLTADSFYAAMKNHKFFGWVDDKYQMWEDFHVGMEALLRLHPELFTIEKKPVHLRDLSPAPKVGDYVLCTHGWKGTFIEGNSYVVKTNKYGLILIAEDNDTYVGNGCGVGFALMPEKTPETVKPVSFDELQKLRPVKEDDSFLCHKSWSSVFAKGQTYKAKWFGSRYKLIGKDGNDWAGTDSLFTAVVDLSSTTVPNTFEKPYSPENFYEYIKDKFYIDANKKTFSVVPSDSKKEPYTKKFTDGGYGCNYGPKEVLRLIRATSWREVPNPNNTTTTEPNPTHDDFVESASITAEALEQLNSNPNDESSSTTNGDINMSQRITVNVSTAPFAQRNLVTVFGNDVSLMGESTIRETLQRVAQERANLKALELGKVVVGSYQDRELKALDAARVALIDALDTLAKSEDEA